MSTNVIKAISLKALSLRSLINNKMFQIISNKVLCCLYLEYLVQEMVHSLEQKILQEKNDIEKDNREKTRNKLKSSVLEIMNDIMTYGRQLMWVTST